MIDTTDFGNDGQGRPLRWVDVGQYRVVFREWTRREVRSLSADEMDDFFCDEVLHRVIDTDTGDDHDPDDMPISDLLTVIRAVGEALAPNGRTGSARRPRTRK